MSIEGGRFNFDDGGTYIGNWLQGSAHNLGLATGPNGVGEYSGEWNFGFEICGVYVWPNGNIYAGEWSKGKRQGLGIQSRGKWIYQGEFNVGTYGLYGIKMSLNSQAKYEGSWNMNRFEGFGIETCPDGSIYAGTWSKGFRHGLGIRHSFVSLKVSSSTETDSPNKKPSNDINVSKPSDSSPNKRVDEKCLSTTSLSKPDPTVASGKALIGRAIMRRLKKQHSAFELGRSINQFSPTLTTANETQVVQSLATDVKNNATNQPKTTNDKCVTPELSVTSADDSNKCNSTLNDKFIRVYEIYSGEWMEDQRSGYGIVKRSNGFVYIGEWTRNQKHGYGIVINPDGSCDEGQFQANQLVARINRKSKLHLIRQTKLKECVEDAISRAQSIAKQARECAFEQAKERALKARQAAHKSISKINKACCLSDKARELAFQLDPQFHQPGIEWRKKCPLDFSNLSQMMDFNLTQLDMPIQTMNTFLDQLKGLSINPKISTTLQPAELTGSTDVPTSSPNQLSVMQQKAQTKPTNYFFRKFLVKEHASGLTDGTTEADVFNDVFEQFARFNNPNNIDDLEQKQSAALNQQKSQLMLESNYLTHSTKTRKISTVQESLSEDLDQKRVLNNSEQSSSSSFDNLNDLKLKFERTRGLNKNHPLSTNRYYESPSKASTNKTPNLWQKRVSSAPTQFRNFQNLNESYSSQLQPNPIQLSPFQRPNPRTSSTDDTPTGRSKTIPTLNPYNLMGKPTIFARDTDVQSLFVQHQHAPKLGLQQTQDSGYMSFEPTEPKSIPTFNRSLSYQMSKNAHDADIIEIVQSPLADLYPGATQGSDYNGYSPSKPKRLRVQQPPHQTYANRVILKPHRILSASPQKSVRPKQQYHFYQPKTDNIQHQDHFSHANYNSPRQLVRMASPHIDHLRYDPYGVRDRECMSEQSVFSSSTIKSASQAQLANKADATFYFDVEPSNESKIMEWSLDQPYWIVQNKSDPSQDEIYWNKRQRASSVCNSVQQNPTHNSSLFCFGKSTPTQNIYYANEAATSSFYIPLGANNPFPINSIHLHQFPIQITTNPSLTFKNQSNWSNVSPKPFDLNNQQFVSDWHRLANNNYYSCSYPSRQSISLDQLSKTKHSSSYVKTKLAELNRKFEQQQKHQLFHHHHHHRNRHHYHEHDGSEPTECAFQLVQNNSNNEVHCVPDSCHVSLANYLENVNKQQSVKIIHSSQPFESQTVSTLTQQPQQQQQQQKPTHFKASLGPSVQNATSFDSNQTWIKPKSDYCPNVHYGDNNNNNNNVYKNNDMFRLNKYSEFGWTNHLPCDNRCLSSNVDGIGQMFVCKRRTSWPQTKCCLCAKCCCSRRTSDQSNSSVTVTGIGTNFRNNLDVKPLNSKLDKSHKSTLNSIKTISGELCTLDVANNPWKSLTLANTATLAVVLVMAFLNWMWKVEQQHQKSPK